MHPELEFRAAQVRFDDLRREADERRRHDLGRLPRRWWWRRTPVEGPSETTEATSPTAETPVRAPTLPAPAARIPGQRVAPDAERDPASHST